MLIGPYFVTERFAEKKNLLKKPKIHILGLKFNKFLH